MKEHLFDGSYCNMFLVSNEKYGTLSIYALSSLFFLADVDAFQKPRVAKLHSSFKEVHVNLPLKQHFGPNLTFKICISLLP